MYKQLNLKNIALIGRTFEEYYNMFNLYDLSGKENILDVASGVSSFCAEANKKGLNVTASDKIYSLSTYEIASRLNAPGAFRPRFLPVPGEVFTEIESIKILSGFCKGDYCFCFERAVF